MSNGPIVDPAFANHPKRFLRARSLVRGMALGAALALLSFLVALIVFARNTAELLTEDALAAARTRWETAGAKSYDMELLVTGNQPGRIQVSVRDGQVVQLIRDGVSPKQRRVWDVWRVEGQFDTLQMELDNAHQPQAAYGLADASAIRLLAEFDAAHGYPRRFNRLVRGKALDMGWEVTKFTPQL